MRKRLILLPIALLLSSCAGHKIIEKSEVYSREMSNLPIREVVLNLSATIDNPYNIPSRTTFGKGNLTFTDNSSIDVTTPFHNIARNSGSLSANIGQFVEAYGMSVSPETSGTTLKKLRDIYLEAVYPDTLAEGAHNKRKKVRWLYWTNKDGSLSRSGVPPVEVSFIGQSERHILYTADERKFSDFILATFGEIEQSGPSKQILARGEKAEKSDSSVKTTKPRSEFRKPATREGIPPRTQPSENNLLTPLIINPVR